VFDCMFVSYDAKLNTRRRVSVCACVWQRVRKSARATPCARRAGRVSDVTRTADGPVHARQDAADISAVITAVLLF